jgi:hypothetical protein
VGRLLDTWQYLYTEQSSTAPSTFSTASRICEASAFSYVSDLRIEILTPLNGRSAAASVTRLDSHARSRHLWHRILLQPCPELRLSGVLGPENSAPRFKCFDNIAITPACRVTLDLQVVEAVQASS